MAQHFINGYPREMFGGRCSSDLFKEELERLPLKNRQKVYHFFSIKKKKNLNMATYEKIVHFLYIFNKAALPALFNLPNCYVTP